MYVYIYVIVRECLCNHTYTNVWIRFLIPIYGYLNRPTHVCVRTYVLKTMLKSPVLKLYATLFMCLRNFNFGFQCQRACDFVYVKRMWVKL